MPTGARGKASSQSQNTYNEIIFVFPLISLLNQLCWEGSQFDIELYYNFIYITSYKQES